MKRKGAKRGSQHYSDRTCARCQESLGRLTPRTNTCRGCNHLVCRDCRIQESNGTWRCKVCTKEMWVLSMAEKRGEMRPLGVMRISLLSLCWLNNKGHFLSICYFLLFHPRELKKATGDWFYDQKVNRFAYRTGSEIIRMSLRRKPAGTRPVWKWFLEMLDLSERSSGVES